MPSKNRTLHVLPSPKYDLTYYSKHQFIVSDQLKTIDVNDQQRWLANYTDIIERRDEQLPVLDALFPYLTLHRYGALIYLTLLYNKLNDKVARNDYTAIETHHTYDFHHAVIKDVAEEYDLELNQDPEYKTSKPTDVLSLDTLKTLADQLISIPIDLFSHESKTSDVLLFGSTGNTNESRVMNSLPCSSVYITSPLTMSRVLRDHPHDFDDSVEVRPLNTFSTFNSIFKNLSILQRLLRQAYHGEWEFEPYLRNRLKTDYDAYLKNTIHQAASVAVASGIRHLLSYEVFREAISENDPEAVIVRGDNPYQRLALAAGKNKDVSLFYLPHSIICGTEILPAQKETDYFVAGEFEADYLQESSLADHLPSIIPSGRPIYDRWSGAKVGHSKVTQPVTVLLGTQPFSDEIRKQFVEVVLRTLTGWTVNTKPLIKVHPSENTDFYEKYISRYPTLSVEGGGIEPYLAKSDMTITINSNVGIEAIFHGNVTISYNEWFPRTAIFPYIDAGPIPLARSPDELKSILNRYGMDELNYLQSAQYKWLEEGFEVGGSTQRVVDHVMNHISNK